MIKVNEKHVDAMLKTDLNEESIEKVNITSVKSQRNALICKKCNKDTKAHETEKIVIICDSCKTAMRKDACKIVNDVIVCVDSG